MGYHPCSYTLHREYLCYISTHFSNLRHILHMFVGLSNLFIAVHSMTGYGVLGVCFFIIFDRSSSIARLCLRVGRSSLTGLRHFVQSVLPHAPYSSIWLTPYSSCLTPVWIGCVLHGCFTSCLISVFLLLYSVG